MVVSNALRWRLMLAILGACSWAASLDRPGLMHALTGFSAVSKVGPVLVSSFRFGVLGLGCSEGSHRL